MHIKLTFNTSLFFDLTASASYNYVVTKEDVTDLEIMGSNSTDTTNPDSEKFQNCASFFLGIEKSLNITNNLTCSLAFGPNFIFLFENNDANSSYYVCGIEGILNLNYSISSKMKLACGIRGSYDPIWGGDFIESQETEVTEIDLANYAYTINATIGFVYKI